MMSILVLNHLPKEDYLWKALFPLLFLSNNTPELNLEAFYLICILAKVSSCMEESAKEKSRGR